MIAVVDPDRVDAVRSVLQGNGERVFAIGRLVAGPTGRATVALIGEDKAWRS